MKVHSFCVEDAKKHGVEKAAILYNLRFWLEKNKANNTNRHDGYYWTFNSAKAFAVLFPYYNESKVNRLLKQMEEDGVILTGNYNKKGYDRTKWYSLPEFSDGSLDITHIAEVQNGCHESEKCNSQKCKMQVAEMQNGFCRSERPIPDINTDSKPNINSDDLTAATKNPEPQILETNQSGFAVTEDLEISEKTKTVRSQKADQVLNWQEPTIATAKEILFLAGKELNLTGTEYRMSVEDFKAYYADQADLGKGLTPRMIQPRFRDWLINDVNKKSRQQPQQTNYQGNNHANHQSANSQFQQPKQSSADQYAAKLAEQRRQRDEAANGSIAGSHHGNVYDMETHF